MNVSKRASQETPPFPPFPTLQTSVLQQASGHDAALAGFDRGETVTIPPLQDEGQ